MVHSNGSGSVACRGRRKTCPTMVGEQARPGRARYCRVGNGMAHDDENDTGKKKEKGGAHFLDPNRQIIMMKSKQDTTVDLGPDRDSDSD